MSKTADLVFQLLSQYYSLTEKRLTISTIESATGGRISDQLTDLSGISDFFQGSIISYSNEIKTGLVGVNKQTIESYGAVSRQTAREMAESGRATLKTDICVSVTGIAGPSGATPQKPVGLFFLGLSADRFIRTQQHQFKGSREENKQFATEAALILFSDYISQRIEQLKPNAPEETHIVTCFLEHEGKILLLKRSRDVGQYLDKWAVISGHLETDDLEQCLTEIVEETGLSKADIRLISRGDNIEITDATINHLWNIHPFRFNVAASKAIKLNFEHTEYQWILPEKLSKHDIVPGLQEAWRSVTG